jgi:hypothetical protein
VSTLLALGLLFAACRMPGGSSPAMHYWLLDPLPGERAEAGEQMVVSVGPVFFPAYLKRTQYVERTGEHRLRVSPVDRWAAPLDLAFGEVLARNLELLTPGLTARDHRELGRTSYDRAVEVTVSRFEVVEGEVAVLDARWTIRSVGESEIVASGQGARKAEVESRSVDDGVAALSRVLGDLSSEIAVALASLE